MYLPRPSDGRTSSCRLGKYRHRRSFRMNRSLRGHHYSVTCSASRIHRFRQFRSSRSRFYQSFRFSRDRSLQPLRSLRGSSFRLFRPFRTHSSLLELLLAATLLPADSLFFAAPLRFALAPDASFFRGTALFLPLSADTAALSPIGFFSIRRGSFAETAPASFFRRGIRLHLRLCGKRCILRSCRSALCIHFLRLRSRIARLFRRPFKGDTCGIGKLCSGNHERRILPPFFSQRFTRKLATELK